MIQTLSLLSLFSWRHLNNCMQGSWGGRSPSHPYSPFPEYSVDDWVIGLIPVPVGPVGSAFGGSICSPSDMSWGEGGRGTQDRSGGGQ